MIRIFHDISHLCSKLTTERYSTSFSSAIRLLRRDLRAPIYDVYGFVRFADEIVDSFHDADRATLLAEFKAETEKAIARGISLNPILNSFQETVNRFNIGHDLIDAFFRSMEQDLSVKSHSTQSYREYIFGSAEAVGLMCLAVFCNGNTTLCEELKPGAQALGAAFQKINFLRDMNADHSVLDRVYFPGVQIGTFNETAKRSIEEDIENDLASAEMAIGKLPRGSRFGVMLAFNYYKTLFAKIRKKQPATLLSQRIRVSDAYKFWILLRTGLRTSFNIF